MALHPVVERRIWDRCVDVFSSRIFVLAAGLCLVALAVFWTSRPIEDLDIWWHLKTGQWICQHHAVPRTDIFSYVLAGKPWVTFEWLSQVFLYKAWSWGGPMGLFILRQSLAAALFAILFVLGGSAGLPTMAILLLGLPLASTGIMERPQMFDYLFALSCRALMPRFLSARRPWAAGAALILIHLLWSNLHGGACVVGLIIMGVYAFSYLWSGDFKTAVKAAGLGALAFLACFVNPHGYRIFTQLLGTWFDPAQHWVLEWKPLAAGTPQFDLQCAYAACLIFAGFRLKGAQRTIAIILAVGFAFVAGFRSARNVPLAFFITVPDLLAAGVLFWKEKPARAAQIFLPLALASLLICPSLIQWVYPGEISPNPITKEWASGVCDFIEREDLPGRMYNDYIIGGYLIWRLGPQRQVFVDGRSLEYGAVMMDAIARISRREGFEALDRVYHFDYLVFQQRPDDRLLYLDNDPDWACVYFDDGGLVYAHRRRAARATAAKLGYRYLRPNERFFNYLAPYAADPIKAKAALKEIDRSIADAPPWLSRNGRSTRLSLMQLISQVGRIP